MTYELLIMEILVRSVVAYCISHYNKKGLFNKPLQTEFGLV